MKCKLNKLMVLGFLVVSAALPQQAESKAVVLAALDNAALTTSETQAVTNGGDTSNAAAATQPAKESTENSKVRIDHSGIHVGGKNPVDIDFPSLKHHDGERAIDWVAIVVPVSAFILCFAIIVIVFYARNRRFKMHQETIRAMIEKGIPIPPEMAAGPRSDLPMGKTEPQRARSDLRGGLILIAVGAGLLMIHCKPGWILVFIGGARLVFWLIEDRKRNP